MVDALRQPNLRRLQWNVKYYLGSYDDRWYASLFRQGAGKVTGEITPAYSILEPDDVAHIHAIMGEAKVIYLLRNPIDRDWSSLRHRHREADSKRPVSARRLDALKRQLMESKNLRRGDYLKTIKIWRRFFPEDQIFIGFFDDISHNPLGLLTQIFEFLGVAASPKHASEVAYDRINASQQDQMPESVRLFLAEYYYEMLNELSDIIGGHANSWLEEAEVMLHSTNRS